MTDHDISSFMNQWSRDAGPAQAPTEKVEDSQPVVYSSALAKLRAKKMSKNLVFFMKKKAKLSTP